MTQPDARMWVLAILRITRQKLLEENLASTKGEIMVAIEKLEEELRHEEELPPRAPGRR